MASSIFYQFQVNKCLVDTELMDHFKNDGWHLKKNEDPFFTKYEWPDIKLSKSIKKFLDDDKEQDFRFAIELLGCYQPEIDSTQEGTVILFYEKLKEAAEQYILDTGTIVSLEKVIDRLTTIILIHEFVHWLIHFVSPRICKLKPVGIRYKTFDELEFHEGFAQIFTYLFAQKKGGAYRDIFNWLDINPPKQYRAYIKLIDKRIKTPSHVITLLSICKLLDIQSMNKALKIADIYPCKDWNTFENVLFEPYKFKAFLSYLDYNEKKRLFNYLVSDMPRSLSDFLRTNKKDFKTYLKLLEGILIANNCCNLSNNLEEVCIALDLKELGF